jgi:esterase/lipase superfamily enzyme
MDARLRPIQAAIQLRDELPAMTGDDWPEADAQLADLLAAALLEPDSAAKLKALMAFCRSRPDWAARFNELVGGNLRGGGGGGGGPAPTRSSPGSPVVVPMPAAAAQPEEATRSTAAFTPMEILYATDRAATGQSAVQRFYGGDRAAGSSVQFGRCVVTLPLKRQRGELNTPGLLDLWRGEDPARHIVLASIEPLQPAAFDDAARRQLGDTSNEGLLFVHGYNVSFHDAARRTAQLAHDLAFEGLRLCYSWPSKGEFLGYAADGDSATWSAPHLAAVIRRLRALKPGLRLHLVAHSMGNRVLTQALRELHLRHEPLQESIQQVALAAPDIDRDVFEGLAEALRSSARRVTLYASSKDRALWVSKLLHRGPRAGDAGDAMLALDGVDAIDASQVESSLIGLNHGYFAGKLSVLSDLALLLRTNTPPGQRPGLRSVPNKRHWLMQP